MLDIVNRCKWGGVGLLLVIDLLLMPFGMNFVHFVSKGLMHHMMMFSFSTALILPLLIKEPEVKNMVAKSVAGRITTFCSILVPLCFIVMTYSNIVYANQVYLKKSLEDKATLSVITRLLDRIEQIDGFNAEVTPIVFIGEPSDAKVTRDRIGFDYKADGLSGHLAATWSTEDYLEQMLGYPFVRGNKELVKEADIAAMGRFPDRDSVRMLDGQIVVRFK